MKEIIINTDYIKLNAFLKYADIISVGSDAKTMIQQQKIKVNNQIVSERGKKLRQADIIEVEGFGEYIIEVKECM